MAATGPDAHALTDRILDRLIADDHGDERWADLVLAACDGPDALTAALDGHGGTRPVRQGTEDKDAAVPEPPGAYLRSITVEGFRGIGPAATLTLTPGPGLTLVVGRNGSGKSSFAEGLEVLLTGGNRRWDGRSAVWKDGWRCLHRPNPCAVRAEFAAEALGTVTLERKWDEAAALDASSARFQAKGSPRRPYEELGWDTAIRTHRPLLPYAELGAVFDRPSEIHDALVEVLGLGELDAIQKTPQNERKSRETIVAAAGARLMGILPRLRGGADASGDQRAVAAARALSGKKPDLDALRQVLQDHGGASPDQGVTLLRQAEMQVIAPLREVVAAASRELREAASSVEQSRTPTPVALVRWRSCSPRPSGITRPTQAATARSAVPPVCSAAHGPTTRLPRWRISGPAPMPRSARMRGWTAPPSARTVCCACHPRPSLQWPRWGSHPPRRR